MKFADLLSSLVFLAVSELAIDVDFPKGGPNAALSEQIYHNYRELTLEVRDPIKSVKLLEGGEVVVEAHDVELIKLFKVRYSTRLVLIEQSEDYSYYFKFKGEWVSISGRIYGTLLDDLKWTWSRSELDMAAFGDSFLSYVGNKDYGLFQAWEFYPKLSYQVRKVRYEGFEFRVGSSYPLYELVMGHKKLHQGQPMGQEEEEEEEDGGIVVYAKLYLGFLNTLVKIQVESEAGYETWDFIQARGGWVRIAGADLTLILKYNKVSRRLRNRVKVPIDIDPESGEFAPSNYGEFVPPNNGEFVPSNNGEDGKLVPDGVTDIYVPRQPVTRGNFGSTIAPSTITGSNRAAVSSTTTLTTTSGSTTTSSSGPDDPITTTTTISSTANSTTDSGSTTNPTATNSSPTTSRSSAKSDSATIGGTEDPVATKSAKDLPPNEAVVEEGVVEEDVVEEGAVKKEEGEKDGELEQLERISKLVSRVIEKGVLDQVERLKSNLRLSSFSPRGVGIALLLVSLFVVTGF